MAKYTVKSGESWASIAGKLYGGDQRYFNVLMQQNPGISMLQPGMVIKAPNLDAYISANKRRGVLHNVSDWDISRARDYDRRSGYEGGLAKMSEIRSGATGGTTPLTSANAGLRTGVASTAQPGTRTSGFIDPNREGRPTFNQPLSGPTGQYGRGGPTRRGRGRDTSRFRTAWLQRMARQRGSSGTGWQQQSPYRPQEPRTRTPLVAPDNQRYQNNWLGDFDEFAWEMRRIGVREGLETETRDRDRGRHDAARRRGQRNRIVNERAGLEQDMLARDEALRQGVTVGPPTTTATGVGETRTYPQGGPQGPRWEGDRRMFQRQQLQARAPGQLAAFTKPTRVDPKYLTPEEHKEWLRGMDVMGYEPILDSNGNVVGYRPIRRKDWDGKPIRPGKPWNPHYLREDEPAAAPQRETPYFPWVNYIGAEDGYKRPVRAFRPVRQRDGSRVAPNNIYRRPSASQYRPPASRPVYRNVRPDPRAFIGATSWRIF